MGRQSDGRVGQEGRSNSLRRIALGQHGDDAHRAGAAIANENVAGKDTFHERGPGESTFPIELTMVGGVIGRRRRDGRHDGSAKMMVRPKHAVIAGEMAVRRRNEGREATQKIDGRERQLGSPVAQGAPERNDDATCRIERDLSIGERAP